MKTCPRHGSRFACNHPAGVPATVVRNHGPGHIEYQDPCPYDHKKAEPASLTRPREHGAEVTP